MWRWPTTLAALLAMLAALPAEAQDEEEREPTAFEEYLFRAGTNAATGLNGILTGPADPVAFAIEGDEVFGSKFWGRVLGFGAGLLQSSYRAVTGGFDVACALVPAMPPLSPVPRYKLIPHEHPDE